MQYPGTTKDHELWLPCPHCEDPGTTKRVHYSVNLYTGKHYCHRCGYGGVLPFSELRELLVGTAKSIFSSRAQDAIQPKLDWHDLLLRLEEGPASPRVSKLARYHLPMSDSLWDAFLSRNRVGDVVGLHLRSTNQQSPKALSFGRRAFGFVGNRLTGPSIRLVEGPYDVVTARDVCLFGLPSDKQLTALYGLAITLCPDADILDDPKKYRRYFTRIAKHFSSLYLTGLQLLPPGKDLDEASPEAIETISVLKLLGPFLKTKRRKRYAQK